MVLSWNDFVSGKTLLDQNLSLTIGVFDGVHLGHRKLINSVLMNRKGGIAAVLTFNPNPRIVLGDTSFPGDISTLEQKTDILLSLGIDKVIVIDFSADFSRLTGEQFLSYLLESSNLKYLVLGDNFRFGYKGMTSSHDVNSILKDSEVEVNISKMAYYKEEIVSSTRIRKDISSGNFKEANAMLNRVFSLDTARIPQVPGEKTITIEKNHFSQILPPQGSYEVEVLLNQNHQLKTECLIERDILTLKTPGNQRITEIKFKTEKQ